MAISTENLIKLKGQYESKRAEDSEYRNMLLDISNYIAPRRGRFLRSRDSTSKMKGGKRTYIYDDTASRAHLITAAGMKGGLCPHALPWFKIGMYDEDLSEFAPVKSWLNTVQKDIYAILSRSNFYAAATSVFTEEVLFGTAPISIDEDDDTHIICRSWTAGEYTLVSDSNGRVRVAFREFYMSPSAIRDRWGDEALSPSLKDLIEVDPFKKVKVVQAVFDRFVRDYSQQSSKNLPVASVFWDDVSTEADSILHEGGFNTWPIMFPRWSQIAEDDYGSDSPAMQVLNDVKSLQEVRKDFLTLSKKAGFPPLIAPAHLKGRIKNFPNAISYVSDTNNQIRPLDEHPVNFAPVLEATAVMQERIEKGFFNDLFLMILNDKNMTATEVAQRHEDKLTILGSVIERQNSEFLSLAIERIFDIGMRKELFPKPPADIEGAELKIDFISMLAQAQRMVGTQAIERSMGFVGAAMEMQPDVVDVFDFDEAIRKYSEMQGADPDLVRPADMVAKIRQARNQMMVQQQQAEMDQQQAQTAQIASQTELGKNSVLDEVIGQR